MKQNPVHIKGFTLVEIIISLAIFSVVAIVALGALLKIISANKKAQTLQSSLTNLNYALETMSRELRVGSRFDCYHSPSTWASYGSAGQPAPSPCSISGSVSDSDGFTTIAFESSNPSHSGTGNVCPRPDDYFAYAYRFKVASNAVTLQKAQEHDCVPIADTPGASDFSDIVSPNVTITNYTVQVNYDVIGQPYANAFIAISGYAGVKESEKTYFNIQTDVGSRTSQ